MRNCFHATYFKCQFYVTAIQASSAYWRGDKDRESLQRVYGISYPDQKSLKVFFFSFIIIWAVQFTGIHLWKLTCDKQNHPHQCLVVPRLKNNYCKSSVTPKLHLLNKDKVFLLWQFYDWYVEESWSVLIKYDVYWSLSCVLSPEMPFLFRNILTDWRKLKSMTTDCWV